MHRFRTGGVEQMFLNVSSQLKADKIRLLVLNSDFDGIYNMIPANVEIVALQRKPMITMVNKMGQKFSFLKPVSALLQLLLMCWYVASSSSLKADYWVNFSDTLSTLLLARFGGGKRYSWIHLNPQLIAVSRWRKIYFRLYGGMDTIVCVCNDQRSLLLKLFPAITPGKVTVIYNSINVADIKRRKNEPLNGVAGRFMLMVARLDMRTKDFITVIDAYSAARLLMKEPYKLVFLGEGEDRRTIQEYIDKSPYATDILLPGNDINPYRWMTKASLFIFSSRFEGFGMVLLEALCCEVPVLSVNCPVGPAEILENGASGKLVPVGDRTAMKNAIVDILTDERQAESFVVAGKQRANQFDVSNSNLVLNNLFYQI